MSRPSHTRRAVLRCTGAAIVTVGTAGCLSSNSDTASEVTMGDGLNFEPATVTVDTGESLTWRNTDTVDHTVTAYQAQIPDGAEYFASGGFESEDAARTRLSEGLLTQGDEYEHSFEQPGTYEYFCVPHENSGMVGTVKVE